MELDIPLDKLLPNPEQPREHFDQAKLQSLAASLKEDGQLQSIAVEEAANGYFIILDGGRRLMAAKRAGLATLRATVNPPKNGNGSQERLTAALVANVQREDLNAIEEAKAYRKLQQMGMSVDRIALKAGRCRKTITDRMIWLDLEDDIQGMVIRGDLQSDGRVAESLLRLPPEERLEFAQRLSRRQGITIRAIINLVDRYLGAQEAHGDGDPCAAVGVFRYTSARPGKKPSGWDALRQVGAAPPWDVVTRAAEATCQGCVLAGDASEKVCRECPAVEFLRRMIKSAERAKA